MVDQMVVKLVVRLASLRVVHWVGKKAEMMVAALVDNLAVPKVDWKVAL